MNMPARALEPHAHSPAGAVAWPLWAGAGLMVLSLAVVAGYRLVASPGVSPAGQASLADPAAARTSSSPAPATPPPSWMPADIRWQRALHFEDGPAGEVVVRDASTGQVMTRYAGEQGFVRGVLRVLVRERARRGIGAQPAFILLAHGPSRLMLADPATGERIHLESFGPSNLAVFAQLREAGR